MTYTYKNRNTGDEVSSAKPIPRLERLDRWERVDALAVAPEPQPAPPDDPPPKYGSGSSRADWAAYAESKGIAVTDEMTRADLWEALEA